MCHHFTGSDRQTIVRIWRGLNDKSTILSYLWNKWNFEGQVLQHMWVTQGRRETTNHQHAHRCLKMHQRSHNDNNCERVVLNTYSGDKKYTAFCSKYILTSAKKKKHQRLEDKKKKNM